jgi:hypothetical protein
MFIVVPHSLGELLLLDAYPELAEPLAGVAIPDLDIRKLVVDF